MDNLKFNIVSKNFIRPLSVRGLYIKNNSFLEISSDSSKKLLLSVLDGFHESSLQEILYKIKQIDFSNSNRAFSFNKPMLNQITNFEFLNLSGEEIFQIETILYFFNYDQHFNTKLNDLTSIYDNRDSFHSNVIKIKFQSSDKSDLLLKKIDKLSSIKNLKLRIDANQSFELEDLLKLERILASNFGTDRIDYFEEPLKCSNDIIHFINNSKIDYALDETFHQNPNYALNNFKTLPIVIKPSLIGLSTSYKFLEDNHDRRFIVSSSYEHSSALKSLHLISSLRPNEFHGLSSFVVD